MSAASKSFLSQEAMTHFGMRERIVESLHPSASSCAKVGTARHIAAANSRVTFFIVARLYASIVNELVPQRFRFSDQLTEPLDEVRLFTLLGDRARMRRHGEELVDVRPQVFRAAERHDRRRLILDRRQ